MNKEILLPAVVAITVALVVVVLAAYRTQQPPTPGVLRRGGMAALLVYAVIAAPVFVGSGMTLVGLVLLVLVIALALAGMAVAERRREGLPGQAEALVRCVVGTGLAAVILIAAGQTIALVGRVDRRTMVVVVALVAGVLVAGQGLAASSRVGSLAMWLTIVFVLVSLALGFLLGGIGEVVSPIVETDGPAALRVVAVGVAVFVVGWSDNGLRALQVVGAGPLGRVFAGAAAVVVLVLLGQLMFLGGSILAPSLQFFVLPANIDIVPALAAAVLALLTVLFAALLAATLAGVGTLGAPGGGVAVAPLWVAAAAGVAAGSGRPGFGVRGRGGEPGCGHPRGCAARHGRHHTRHRRRSGCGRAGRRRPDPHRRRRAGRSFGAGHDRRGGCRGTGRRRDRIVSVLEERGGQSARQRVTCFSRSPCGRT